MKQKIRQLIDQTRNSSARPVERPYPQPPAKLVQAKATPPLRSATTPLLVSDLVSQQCLLEVNDGKVLTLKEITEKLHMSKETVRRTFMNEPGVIKIGGDYRVPQYVFDRVVIRAMNK
jgi:hypothetical protein